MQLYHWDWLLVTAMWLLLGVIVYRRRRYPRHALRLTFIEWFMIIGGIVIAILSILKAFQP